MSEQLGGIAGKILRVDLTNGLFSTVDTKKYVPKYVGGYGIALRLCWEEIAAGVKAFDPENKLYIMNGVASGTPSPSSGRCNVLTISPHSYPEQLTNSSIGGHFPARLKWNGYDGIIIEGKAQESCVLVIEDGVPRLEPAKELWGLGLIDSQQILAKRNGGSSNTDIYGIGPAGENLVRFAIIGCGAHNATGQGGAGAVMGSKLLKAIVLKGGKDQCKIDDVDALLTTVKEFMPIKRKRPLIYGNLAKKEENPWWEDWTGGKPGGDYHASEWMGDVNNMPYPIFAKSCATACLGGCGFFEFRDVPPVASFGLGLGMSGCMHTRYEQYFDRVDSDRRFEIGMEIHILSQQLGFGHHEITYGLIQWFDYAKAVGLNVEELLGMEIETHNNEWWIKVLRMIAYRQGFGDTMAEGLRRTVEKLGREKYGLVRYNGPESCREDAYKEITNGHIDGQGAWGYVSRGIQREMPFPAFLPGTLCWLIDTRDPHHNKWPDWIHNQFREWVMAPTDKYSDAFPVKWAKDATIRGILIDCLPVCFQFPLRKYMGWRWEDEDTNIGEGTPSTGMEASLYSAVTGEADSEADYYNAGIRLNTLTRAILCRNHERTAKMEFDEMALAMEGVMDEEKFKITVANWYEALGWNRETGYPTREHLKEMDLEDLVPELEKIGKLG